MQSCGDNRMGRSVLSQQRIRISVEPEVLGRNCIAEGSVLPISVAQHPNIVAALLERCVEIVPTVCELLESATTGMRLRPTRFGV